MIAVNKIRQIVERVSPIIAFDRVEVIGTNCRYYSCDTSYAMNGRTIVLAGNSYEIETVSPNKYIEIENPGSCMDVTTGTLDYDLHFFYGTVINTNNELTGIPDTDDKVPMVYLLEPFEDYVKHDNGKSIERETSCHLYFLSWSNYWDWQTQDHHKIVLDVMETLAQKFMETAYDSGLTFPIEEYRQLSRVNFGVYKENRDKNRQTAGAEARKFNDQLSGIEIKVTLPFLRVDNCCKT